MEPQPYGEPNIKYNIQNPVRITEEFECLEHIQLMCLAHRLMLSPIIHVLQ